MKPRVIWKFRLPSLGRHQIELPKNSRFVSALGQGGGIVVYAEVDPTTTEKEIQTVFVYPTGFRTLHEEATRFLGTVVVDAFVFHVYEGG